MSTQTTLVFTAETGHGVMLPLLTARTDDATSSPFTVVVEKRLPPIVDGKFKNLKDREAKPVAQTQTAQNPYDDIPIAGNPF